MTQSNINQKLLTQKRDMVASVYNIIEFQVAKYERSRKWIIPYKSPDREWNFTIHLLYSKALRSYRAIKELCYNGYAPESYPLLRTLFEIELYIIYLSIKGPKLAQRYLSFMDFKKYDHYLKDPNSKTLLSMPRGKRNEFLLKIKDEYEKHLDLYPDQKNKKNDWTGKSIKKIAEEIDEHFDYSYDNSYAKSYNINYSLYSSFIHSDAIILSTYITKSFNFKTVPDLSKIEPIFLDATIRFAKILFEWMRIFELASEEEIRKIDTDLGLYCKHKFQINKWA